MYDKTSKKKKFLITDNCRMLEDPEVPGIPYFLTKDEISEKFSGAKTDNKLDIVSINSCADKAEIINYYLLMYTNLSNEFYSAEKSDVLTYLDMGYVPIYYAPEYIGEDTYYKVLQNIKNSGVDYKETPFIRLSGRTLSITNDCRDIWCYKPDIMKFQGKSSLADVNIGDFLFDMLEGVD